MILGIDVYYKEDKAKVVGVLFSDWKDAEPREMISVYVDHIEAYESGSFYKRELPCIMELLKKVTLPKIEFIIIDGYVYLDDLKKKGLGAILYEQLDQQIPVIGVAKSSFHNNTKMTKALLRGDSSKNLYISAIGIDIDQAVLHIKDMNGSYRIPTLLKQLDQETKNWLPDLKSP